MFYFVAMHHMLRDSLQRLRVDHSYTHHKGRYSTRSEHLTSIQDSIDEKLIKGSVSNLVYWS